MNVRNTFIKAISYRRNSMVQRSPILLNAMIANKLEFKKRDEKRKMYHENALIMHENNLCGLNIPSRLNGKR